MASTIRDIANRTGLGLATISKYLNGGNVREENRQAIEAAIRELDYRTNEFARSLKTGRARTVGVVIPELSNTFVTTIITVLEDILRRSGYAVMVCDCRTNPELEREAVRFLLSRQVDGIVNMPVDREGSHLAPALEQGVPVVLLDRMITALEEQVDTVLADNVNAARNATKYLLERGHRRIGIVVGPQDVYTSGQRLTGYREVHAQRGLHAEDTLMVHSNYTVQGGVEGVRGLLNLAEKPDAIFLTNYEITLGAVIALNEAGLRIPQALSVIGFDSLQLLQVVQPRLTVVAQPLELMGREVAGMLLSRLERGYRGEGRTAMLSTEIREGESVLDRGTAQA